MKSFQKKKREVLFSTFFQKYLYAAKEALFAHKTKYFGHMSNLLDSNRIRIYEEPRFF